jgi:acetyl esterase/lipase
VIRLALIVLAWVLAAAPALASNDADAGVVPAPPASVEELRREAGRVELDVPYAATGNPRHRLDLYLPRQRAREALAVVVFFHGGGWQDGDKSSEAGRLLPFLRTGEYAAVAADYRLSGEATWPAQIHDCKAAIRWVRANAAKYGLDADRIGVWGASAGAHLALLIGLGADAPELEGQLGLHRDVSSRVAGVVSFFAPTELLAEIGQPSDIDRASPDAPEARLVGGPLRENEARAREASPTTYASSGDAPVLSVHGTADRTVPYDQAVRLDAALRKAGVPSYFVTIEGGGHGDFGTAADDRVEAFFAKYLLGKPAVVSTQAIVYPGR